MGDDRKASDTVVDAGIALTAGLVAAAATKDPATGVAVSAATTGALGIVRDKLKAWTRDRAERWWAVLLEDATVSAEVAAERVANRMSDPKVASVISRSIRAALETPHEDVVASLAVLAKLYIGESGVSERFFRGAARLLEDALADDIEMLRRLFSQTVALGIGDEVRVMFVPKRTAAAPDQEFRTDMDELGDEREDSDALTVIAVRTTALASIERKAQVRDIAFVEIDDPARMVHGLTSCGLGRVESLWGADGASMRMDDVRALARVLLAQG